MNKSSLPRLNGNFDSDLHGLCFVHPSSQIFDLSEFRILDSSVDTVRQLYQGKLKSDIIDAYTELLETDFKPIIEHDGKYWVLRRSGKSGFSYSIQNVDYGIVILLKSTKTKIDVSGTHCKVELSPKLLRDHCPDSVQILMDDLVSDFFIHEPVPCGCVIHLATDFQGWSPSIDFAAYLTCRSQRVTDRSGFDSLAVTTGETAAVYGRGQSYTFGTASSLQFALYNKSLEIRAHDKIQYFETIWKSSVDHDLTTRLYDPELPVWRVEFRFHQSVIKQFAETNQDILTSDRLNTFSAVSHYLGNLWRYALDRFRYDLDDKYVHPVWTLLHDDTEFFRPHTAFFAKRTYKKSGVGNERNVQLALGNLLSIYARNNIGPRKAWKSLKNSGMWRDLIGYIKSRGLTQSDLFASIERGLLERRLTSKVAA